MIIFLDGIYIGMRVRIALLIPDLSNTAPTLVARELVIQYLNHGHQVEVFYFKNRSEVDFPCSCTMVAWYSLIDYSRFDMVHGHMLHADLHVKLNRLLGRNKNTKFVCTIHNMVEEDTRYQHGRLRALWVPACGAGPGVDMTN